MLAIKVGVTMARNNKLVRDLERYEELVMDEVRDIILQTFIILKRDLIARMPEDTGWLKESTDYVIASDGLSGELLINSEYSIYVNFGTGIYAQGPGGSKAKKIPWVYYDERRGRFFVTYGQRPANFWDPAIEHASKYFVRRINGMSR